MGEMMTAPQNQAQQKANNVGRGISYPAVSLAEAVSRAQEFWTHERKNSAPLDAAAAHWGYSPNSSGVRTLVAALLSYGLMIDKGSARNRQIQLSDRGLDIVLDTPSRAQALIDAVKNPKIYSDLLNEWNPENLPSDQTIKAHLLRNKNFNPKAVYGFIKDFRASISFSGLDKGDNIPQPETEAGTSPMQEANSHSQGRAKVVNALLQRQHQPIASTSIGRITSPGCSLSVLAEGVVTRGDLEKLIKLVELMRDSYPKSELQAATDKPQ